MKFVQSALAWLVVLSMVASPADVSACFRCRRNPCRYHVVAKYVAPAPTISTTNIILNNLIPSGFPYPQQGQSVYGVQQASYQDSSALFMDRALRLEELRTANADRGYAEFQETGRLQLQLNADTLRQQTNAGLAYAAMEANRGTTNQTLQIRIQDGQMSIVQPGQPGYAQPQQQQGPPGPQQLVAAQSCANCHDGRGTGNAPKDIILDGSAVLTEEVLTASIKAIWSGKMPPKSNLTADQKAVISASLSRWQPTQTQPLPPPPAPHEEMPPPVPADNNFGKPPVPGDLNSTSTRRIP